MNRVELLVWCLLALVLLGGISCAAELQQGRFVYRSEIQDVQFLIEIPAGKLGHAIEIPFTATSPSGAGASFEGVMTGVPSEGLWSVSFTDSFNNTGKGTIMLRPGLVFLTLKLEQTEEPRCSRFYGSMRLVKEG